MRIDGPRPIPSAGSEPEAREVKPNPVARATAAFVSDHAETEPEPEANRTNVLVEIRSGNIMVYRFVDERSGRLIEQIPSEQMLKISQGAETPKKRS